VEGGRKEREKEKEKRERKKKRKKVNPPLSHYLRRVRGPLRIFLPSDLPGTSPSTSYSYHQWTPALSLGTPFSGFLPE
jgi:hypothetical protein